MGDVIPAPPCRKGWVIFAKKRRRDLVVIFPINFNYLMPWTPPADS
jgi:hypothetical protein